MTSIYFASKLLALIDAPYVCRPPITLPLVRLASIKKSFKDSLDITQIELHILMSNDQWQ